MQDVASFSCSQTFTSALVSSWYAIARYRCASTAFSERRGIAVTCTLDIPLFDVEARSAGLVGTDETRCRC